MIDFKERIESLTQTLAELNAQLLSATNFKVKDVLEARIRLVEDNIRLNKLALGG